MEAKRFIMVLITIVLAISPALAEIKTGSCGPAAKYTLNTETGLLKIEGSGNMNDYASYNSIPWYSYRSSIIKIEIEGINNIGDYAFYNCSGLISVTIPNSVTSIGEYAFSGCSGLISVTIGNSVTSIGKMAFDGCSGLTSVTIPNSVTSIGDWAFDTCSGLTSVTIPNSVTSIGSGAFKFCSGLTSVTIPNSVTSIGEQAFSCCSDLTSVTVDADNPNYCSDNNVIYTKDKSMLVYYMTSKKGSFVIPSSVTSIGGGAFFDCSGLTSVTIPNSVTSIGKYAFSYCSGLTSVTIPNSVTSIGNNAFYDCSGLTSVTIPNSVTSIGGYAFYDCSGLTSVTIPNSVTSIGKWAFGACKGLTSVTIGNSVKSIGEYAFYQCFGLISVTIGNSVTSIGERAFYDCDNIQILHWNCNLQSSASLSTSNLRELYIGDNVEILYNFFSVKYLKKVVLGKNVKYIRQNVFNGSNLQEFHITGTEVPYLYPNVFANANLNHTMLYVPEEKVTYYKTTEPWSLFGRVYGPGKMIVATYDSKGVASASLNGLSWTSSNGSTFDLKDSRITSVECELEKDPSNCYALVKDKKITYNKVDDELEFQVNAAAAKSEFILWINIIVMDTEGEKTVIHEAIKVRSYDAPVNCTGISLSSTSKTIKAGDTFTLTAAVSPADATDKSVSWSSDDSSVAMVDAYGKITAMGIGSATITCAANDGSGVKATCLVTVETTKVSAITLSETTKTVKVGDTFTLTSTISPTNATDKSVSWSSSNSSIAKVDATGKVTAMGLGSATITCAANDGSGVKATCNVTVEPVMVSSVSLSKTSAEMEVGESVTLTATISPTNASNRKVTWTSSNESVALVSASGKIIAVSPGSADIICSAADGSGVKATCKVKVNAIKVKSISLNKSALSMEAGDNVALTASVSPSNAANKNVTWTTSNEDVAMVTSSGKVIAMEVGTATITCAATDGSGVKATCQVTVKPITVKSISLDKTSATLAKGETMTLIATVLPENAANKEVTWKSSNDDILMVTSKGKVVYVGEGTVTITATTTDGTNLSASCVFNCVDGIITITSDGSNTAAVYGTNGARLNGLRQGINIVVGKDGKRVKVIKK